jgi:hypothetical protein
MHPLHALSDAELLAEAQKVVKARALREAQRVLDEHTVEALRDYPNLANLYTWIRMTRRDLP